MDKNNDDNDNQMDIERIKQELLADDEKACINQNIVNNEELDSSIQDKDYAEFVINTIKRTVKQEDSLVRQIFYSTLSAYTKDPINLGIIAPTSEGKTYPVIESIKLFPKEDVWLIGKMSTKMLVRQKGVLVDENNEPIKPKIKELKKKIENAKQDKDKERLEELNERLVSLFENARTLIELRGKILVFLEPPEHELWNLLKPILSHDSEEIEFPFVDKTERGFEAKRVVVKGWPACIFCSAKDESNWSTWPEIVSRSLITSPNMNPEKYRESNLLIAQRKGLPGLIQQRVIVSDEEIRLAKLCILNLKQQIQNYSSNNNPVWIPFLEILAEALPAEKGPDNRITKRMFSFLEIIVLAKSHIRKKLMLGLETQAIAALEDLSQVLYITQNVSGMPSYKLKFFKDYFVPLVESKPEVDSDTDSKGNIIKEKIIGVTTRELCEYYKQQTGKSINTDTMKKIYLNELLNNGYIDEEDSLIDKRQKIYRHIVDVPASLTIEKISNYRIPDQFDNFMQYSKLILPKNFTNIPENWLKLEILSFLKYRIDPPRLLILDENNNEVCLCKFIEEYEKYTRLIRYFSKPKFREYHSKLFGIMKYFKQFTNKEYEKLSNCDRILQLDISDGQIDNTEPANIATISMAARNNVSYQHQIIQKQNNPSLWNNVLTEFPGRVIEEAYSVAMTGSPGNNIKDESYWTKGKWREYLQQEQRREPQQNFEQETNGEVTE